MRLFKFLILLLLIIGTQSCTKGVDFDQIDDASVQTSYVLTLAYVNFTAPNFLNNKNEEIAVTSDFIIRKFDDSGKDYLEKLELTLEIENTFDRDFIFSLGFYNEIGDLIYTIEPIVNIAENSELTTILEIPIEDTHYFYEAKFFGFTFVLPTSNSGNTIDLSTEGSLTIRSAIELFFNFRLL